jgi:Rps23 Pro-64 3,4-dihydroxylase Tpa1-like proline 4-hydroxylase
MLLNKYIKVYPQLINLNTTSCLVRYANKLNFEKAGVGIINKIDDKIRKVLKYNINSQSKSLTDVHWANYLHSKIVNAMNFYLNENYVKSFEIEYLSQIDILKYFENHHYQFHVDASPAHHRTLSAILFLNNDYKGGRLIFKTLSDEEEITIEPTPGSLIIWPSNFLFPHMVKPVTEGVRYTIVAWA